MTQKYSTTLNIQSMIEKSEYEKSSGALRRNFFANVFS